MKAEKKISSEDYILAILSPQERLEAAFDVAREAFKATTLKAADVRAAVEKVRKRVYAQRQKKDPSLEARLARLAARGTVTLPTQKPLKRVRLVNVAGSPISKVLVEDRR